MAITYTPTTNFGAKDSLPTNDPDKVIKGSEFTTEFTALQTAFSLAAPNASPTFTGTVTIPTADINGGNIDGTVIGAVTPAAGSFTTVSATGNITVGGTVDGRDVAADGTKLDGIEAGADVTDTTNVTAAGALMDSELTNIAAVKALNQGVATTDSPSFAGLTATGSVSLAGASTTADITFGDNDKAIFGAGSDLQIHHDGSNSYINEVGTGSLRIRSNQIRMEAPDSQNMVIVTEDAGVQAFYNGTQRLEVTNTGIDVTGTVTADGLTVDGNAVINTSAGQLDIKNRGSGSVELETASTGSLVLDTTSLEIEKNAVKRMVVSGTTGDISFYEDTGTTPKFFWDASAESLGIGTSSPSTTLVVSQPSDNTDVAIFHAGGGTTNRGLKISTFSSVNSNAGVLLDAQTTIGGAALAFATAGTERMRINSSGNVGIGTTSPAYNLDVSKGSAGTAARFTASTDNGRGLSFISSDNGIFLGAIWTRDVASGSGIHAWSINSSEKMRIDSAGNVGIGTSSPAYLLHVNGGNQFNTGWIRANTGTAANPNFTVDGGAGLFKPTSNEVAFSTASTERMRIDSSGNVGIGSTDAASYGKFLVNGTGNLINANASSGAATFQLYEAGAGRFGITTLNGSAGAAFTTAGTERMRIDSAGNVGIGTSSPLDMLHLNGAANSSTGLTIGNNNSTRLRLYHNDAAGASYLTTDGMQTEQSLRVGSGSFLAFDTNGSEAMRIDASGILSFSETSTASFPARSINAYNNGYTYITGGVNGIILKDASASGSRVQVNAATIQFEANGSERARIDASGNLLVGKTTTALGTVGHEFGASGYAYHTRDGNNVLYLNRNTSDGDIARFYKDGAAVGSIGNNTDFYIASQDGVGLRFTSNQVLPCSESGATQNGSRDLGSSSARFKDLYLGGTAVINQTAGTYTIDSSSTTVIAASGTVDFANSSGLLIVNNHSLGHVSIYIAGAGATTLVASVGSAVGTFTYNSGVNGYTFTNNSGSSYGFGFCFIRTRPNA